MVYDIISLSTSECLNYKRLRLCPSVFVFWISFIDILTFSYCYVFRHARVSRFISWVRQPLNIQSTCFPQIVVALRLSFCLHKSKNLKTEYGSAGFVRRGIIVVYNIASIVLWIIYGSRNLNLNPKPFSGSDEIGQVPT